MANIPRPVVLSDDERKELVALLLAKLTNSFLANFTSTAPSAHVNLDVILAVTSLSMICHLLSPFVVDFTLVDLVAPPAASRSNSNNARANRRELSPVATMTDTSLCHSRLVMLLRHNIGSMRQVTKQSLGSCRFTLSHCRRPSADRAVPQAAAAHHWVAADPAA